MRERARVDGQADWRVGGDGGRGRGLSRFAISFPNPRDRLNFSASSARRFGRQVSASILCEQHCEGTPSSPSLRTYLFAHPFTSNHEKSEICPFQLRGTRKKQNKYI